MDEPDSTTAFSSGSGTAKPLPGAAADDTRLRDQVESGNQGHPQKSESPDAGVHGSAPMGSGNGLTPQSYVRRRDFSKQFKFSLREYLGLMLILILLVGSVFLVQRVRVLETELNMLRVETGYLQQTAAGCIAAARAPSDQPLTYRARVRVPEGAVRHRLAYSTIWPKKSSGPRWYGAVPVPVGESVVTVRILEDPRDGKWKIAALVSSMRGNQRMATVLPPEHVDVFRGSHDVLSTGVGRETQSAERKQSIRLLDERWLVGEGGLLLYGDRAPENDQIGVYAELQPDLGPLQ